MHFQLRRSRVLVVEFTNQTETGDAHHALVREVQREPGQRSERCLIHLEPLQASAVTLPNAHQESVWSAPSNRASTKRGCMVFEFPLQLILLARTGQASKFVYQLACHGPYPTLECAIVRGQMCHRQGKTKRGNLQPIGRKALLRRDLEELCYRYRGIKNFLFRSETY